MLIAQQKKPRRRKDTENRTKFSMEINSGLRFFFSVVHFDDDDPEERGGKEEKRREAEA